VVFLAADAFGALVANFRPSADWPRSATGRLVLAAVLARVTRSKPLSAAGGGRGVASIAASGGGRPGGGWGLVVWSSAAGCDGDVEGATEATGVSGVGVAATPPYQAAPRTGAPRSPRTASRTGSTRSRGGTGAAARRYLPRTPGI